MREAIVQSNFQISGLDDGWAVGIRDIGGGSDLVG